MKFGLKEEVIASIQKCMSDHPCILKALIYGSRAKGNFRNSSDIDLTLFGEGLTTSEVARLSMEIDDLLLPYKIDISIFDKIDNPELRAHIERVGVIFYEKDSSEDAGNRK